MMNKELDYLDDILKNEPMTLNKRMIIEIIKEKIQRLESIDNAKPSGALKSLEVLEKIISPLLEPILAKYEDDLSDKITANYFALKQALIKAQEQEKVLEIIKEKDVDIKFLRALINSDSEYTRKNALKIYNLCLDNEQLTEEEFGLLKRWLG